MLAYVFWHRPRDPGATEPYEHALEAFHRSLARTPPVGLRASAAFRVAELPWLAQPAVGEPVASYEDWYLVEDYTALGVLNEAAVAHGHASAHDEIAQRFAAGAGGLYALIEGHADAASLGRASKAVWIARPLGVGARRRGLGELLGDGIDPAHASLWRRQLVFGPAPEFCLLASEVPAGAAPARLPDGWHETILDRETVWDG